MNKARFEFPFEIEKGENIPGFNYGLSSGDEIFTR
jgi:hypothetical protein